MSNLNVLGAFVASALAIADLDGKSLAAFRDFSLFSRFFKFAFTSRRSLGAILFFWS
jgi:hypothetical protein